MPPRSSSSKWTEADALNFLSVQYVAAPYGEWFRGKTVHEAYLNLFHDEYMANIPAPRSDPTSQTMRMIQEFSSVFDVMKTFDMDPFDLAFHNKITGTCRGAGRAAKRVRVVDDTQEDHAMHGIGDFGHVVGHHESHEEDWTAVMTGETPAEGLVSVAPLLQLSCCITKLEGKLEQLQIDAKNDIITMAFAFKMSHRLCCLKLFMESVMKLIQRVSVANYLNKSDEDCFKQLFLQFAQIFSIPFRLVNSFRPLTVRGAEVAAVPDLVYEHYKSKAHFNHILVINILEVKKDFQVRSRSGVGLQQRKRPFSEVEVQGSGSETAMGEPDNAFRPEDVHGQHACQLVRALCNTAVPNKECMLGFIVQATKVRLTCLVMKEEHLEELAYPDFDTEDHQATIYYTRPFDMLSAKDREHLIRIMVTLLSLEKAPLL